MNAAALGATPPPQPQTRPGVRVDTGPDSRAPASTRGARGAVSDANAAGSEPTDAAQADARAFADLLAPPPAPGAARGPSQPDARAETAEPAETPIGGERAPGQLLAMLAGQWLGAQAPGTSSAADATTGVAGLPGLPAATAAALAGAPVTGASDAAVSGPSNSLAADALTAASTAGPDLARATAAAASSGDAHAAPALALAALAVDAAATADAGNPAEAMLSVDTPETGIAGSAPLAAPRAPAAAAPQPAVPVPLPMPADPSAGFDDGFGTRIAWMAEQRLGHAEIRLNPEHVGPIDVRVELDGDRVRAEFQSAHAEVRQAIEASLPRLRELLGQHGLQLGQADVGQRQAGQDGSAARGDAAARGESRPGDDAPPATAAQVRLRGLLDEYA